MCLGLGYYYNQQGAKEYDESLKLHEKYKNATSDFDAKWKVYEDKYKSHEAKFDYRNTFYAISILSSGFGIYATFIHKKAIQKKLSIRIYPDQIKCMYYF